LTSRDKESYTIQSVENALDVLEALGEGPEDIRISNLSSRLGLNKTSVFRLLATFERRGYVEKEDHNGTYRLGLTAYEIGQKFLQRMELLRKAKPHMERLAYACDEAVYLAVPRGVEVLFLDMVDTSQQVKTAPLVGQRFPISETAAGKAILATPTPPTQQTAASLTPEENRSIIERGGCIDRGVLGEGIASVAVPIFAPNDAHLGALVVVAPDFRLDAGRVQEQILPQLIEAGEITSSKLGHIGHLLNQ